MGAADRPAAPEPPPLKEAPKFEGLRRACGPGEANVLAQASALGLTFVAATLLGLSLGWWLDRKLDTAPWLLLLGLAVGLAAGFKNLFDFSNRLTRLERIRDAGGRPSNNDRP